MKSTGIVRHIDNLGRITLPIELRKTLDMACGDPLEIYTEGNSVILRKHESSCVFCGSNKKVTLYKDKCICDNCRRELALEHINDTGERRGACLSLFCIRQRFLGQFMRKTAL